jgi:hypothetical protein
VLPHSDNNDQNDGYGIGYQEIRGSNLWSERFLFTRQRIRPLDLSGRFRLIRRKSHFEAEASGEVSYNVYAYEKNTLEFVGTAVSHLRLYDVRKLK